MTIRDRLPRRLHLCRTAWNVLAYAVLCVGVALAFQANQHEERDRNAALAAEARARAHDQCVSSVQGRQVLRDLVALSTSGNGVDFKALPSYPKLDPASKAVFDELGALLRSTSGPSASFRDRALAQLPIPDCD